MSLQRSACCRLQLLSRPHVLTVLDFNQVHMSLAWSCINVAWLFEKQFNFFASYEKKKLPRQRKRSLHRSRKRGHIGSEEP
eukprot:75608-Pelagomonas_calceolata.AAC.1